MLKTRMLAPSIKRYLNHLRNSHSHEADFKVTCLAKGCSQTFTVFSSFTSHLSRKHGNINDIGFADLLLQNDDIDVQYRHAEEEDRGNEQIAGRNEEYSLRSLSLYALKTQEINRISDTALNDILDSTNSIVEQNLETFKRGVKRCLEDANLDINMIEGLPELLGAPSAMSRHLRLVQSAKNRSEYLIEELGIVEPEEIILGEELIDPGPNVVGQLRIQKHSYQYISILKVLQKLLNQCDVYSQVENLHQSSDGKMRDFCDGNLFSPGGHPLFSINAKALQILLFYDDFEIANPLGAKATIHKIGGFYWVLGNIHPKYRSALKALQVVILCPVKYIKKYGMDKILHPLMADLAMLESENGVRLQLNNHTRLFSGTIGLCQGVILGSNAIGGFMESFGAKRPCRFCMGLLETFQTKFTEEEFDMRTRQGHNNQTVLVANDTESSSAYGVKRQAALNNSRFFHVVDGLPSDIMHDILEGILPRHVKTMLNQFIHVEKIFTLQELNNRISTFPYGLTDSANKPSPITNLSTSDGQLKQSASQMWCLGRLLPFIMHGLVPENDPNWELYLDLMHIDLVFAPVTSNGATYYLRILIRDYLKEFKELYSGVNLVPKHHFMVHYPGQIRRYGPLIRQWCMRGEAKHHYFKKLAHGMTNFKNMCLTLAKRHQRLQCYWLSEDGSYLRPSVDIGPGAVVYFQDLEKHEKLRLLQLYPNLSPQSAIFRAKWVQLNGTKYIKANVVISGHGLLPQFVKIEAVFVMPNKDVIFWCKKMHTTGFHRHLWSYEVMLLNDEVSTTYEELADHHPLDCYSLTINNISKRFVRLRYDLSDLE